jgi:hypothetical protein
MNRLNRNQAPDPQRDAAQPDRRLVVRTMPATVGHSRRDPGGIDTLVAMDIPRKNPNNVPNANLIHPVS